MNTLENRNEAESIKALRLLTNNLSERDESFALSMCDQYGDRGYLSDKQWPWVDKLIERAKPRVSEPHTFQGDEPAGEFAPIADLFASAAKSPKNPKGLVHPKLKFDLSFIDETWRGDLMLKRAGEQSRYPGAVNVSNGLPFGDPANVWYGRIHKDGRFEQSRDCTDIIRGVLIAVNADPAKIAAEYGRKSCHCCFCFALLTDEKDNRSVAQGYGPVCASRYGLPWG